MEQRWPHGRTIERCLEQVFVKRAQLIELANLAQLIKLVQRETVQVAGRDGRMKIEFQIVR